MNASDDEREMRVQAVWQRRPVERRRMHFVRETHIQAEPNVVFAFHESPEALAQLIPPWEKVRVASSDGSLKRGSQVILAGSLAFLPLRWVAIHYEYEPPALFSDLQVSGPFAWWYHRHRFGCDPTGGTLLRDEIEYTLPLGALGRLVAGGLIRKKLERMFEYRHQKTSELCSTTREGC